jgi:hypothetical protein
MVRSGTIIRLYWGSAYCGVRLSVTYGSCLVNNPDKIDLVKSILVSLHTSLKEGEDKGRKYLRYTRLEPSDFFNRKTIGTKPVSHLQVKADRSLPASTMACLILLLL